MTRRHKQRVASDASPVASVTSKKNRSRDDGTDCQSHLHRRMGGNHPPTHQVQYNPTELSYDKGAEFAEIAIPGLDAGTVCTRSGRSFDTRTLLDTEQGGSTPTSVTTRRIASLAIKIEPTRHAPPICTFVLNDGTPGVPQRCERQPAATASSALSKVSSRNSPCSALQVYRCERR